MLPNAHIQYVHGLGQNLVAWPLPGPGTNSCHFALHSWPL